MSDEQPLGISDEYLRELAHAFAAQALAVELPTALHVNVVIDGANTPIVTVTFRRYDHASGEMVSAAHAVTWHELQTWVQRRDL